MPTRSVIDMLKNSKPVIVQYDDSVMDVAKSMVKSCEDAALVVKNELMVGLVTEADLIRRILLTERKIRTTQVQSIMTHDIVIIGPDSRFGHALYLMHEYEINHIPVVDHGKPLGIISISEAVITGLEPYAHKAEMLDHIAEIL